MGDFPRKADGRRIFSAEFKRGVVQLGMRPPVEYRASLELTPPSV